MKKTKSPANLDLPASLRASLDELNGKYARRLQKTVMKIVKKMSRLYADLLDKELHRAADQAPSPAGAKPAPPKQPRWTHL